MAFLTGRYLACTVALTTGAANLKNLIETLLGVTLQDSWRAVILQVDPEGTSDSVRVGDATLGTTGANSKVQKGYTMAAAASLTIESATETLVPLGSIFVQAATTTPNLNVQLFPL